MSKTAQRYGRPDRRSCLSAVCGQRQTTPPPPRFWRRGRCCGNYSSAGGPERRAPRWSMPCAKRSDADHDIWSGSPSRMRSVRRISLGMTTRPSSSMRRTIPVAFKSQASSFAISFRKLRFYSTTFFYARGANSAAGGSAFLSPVIDKPLSANIIKNERILKQGEGTWRGI